MLALRHSGVGRIESWQLKCPNRRHYEHFGIYSYAL
jgi:hypothetical protein